MKLRPQLAAALRWPLRAAARVFAAVVAPWFLCAVALCAGFGLMVSGVLVLAGLGWALLAGSVPCLWFGYITLRGLARG